MTPQVTPKCSHCLAPGFISKFIFLPPLPHEAFASIILIHLPDPKYIFLPTFEHIITYTWIPFYSPPLHQSPPPIKILPILKSPTQTPPSYKTHNDHFRNIQSLYPLNPLTTTVHDFHVTPITSFISTCYHRPIHLVGTQQTSTQWTN